jgi:UDP-N-acetylmuramate dehydrogenase
VLVSDEGFPGLVIRVAIKGIEWREDSHRWRRRRLGQLRSPMRRAQSGGRGMFERHSRLGWRNSCAKRRRIRPGSQRNHLRKSASLIGEQNKLSNLATPNAASAIAAAFSIRPNATGTSCWRSAYALKATGEPALRYPDVKNFFAGRADQPTLAEVRQAVIEIRSRKSMVIVPNDPNCRSAGSFFKNPTLSAEAFAKLEAAIGERPPSFPAANGNVKVPAAWLIERAGFQRGYAKGRAGISSKHTLAIINRGNATAQDVLDLVVEIQARVQAEFGVALLPEPVFVGFNS